MTDAQLYDAKNIDALAWPDTPNGRYAENYLTPLVKKGIAYFIDNIDVEMNVLKIEDHIFPVLVATENYSNSWVCSPYAHYISYGKEFSGIAGNVFLSMALKNLMKGFGKISRFSRMNSVVYVNNWMFSTDLYPESVRPDQIESMTSLLKWRFPQHAIVFRSLNNRTTPIWMDTLQSRGFHLIASRYVFITDTREEAVFKTRILKSDLKLWKESPYQILNENELQVEDCNQLLDLYRTLYVVQHSHLQPQFNNHYFRMLFEKRLLRFIALKSEGKIKGVAGYYKRCNVMMCPIFGYEKNSSESNVIYRLLNTALLLQAKNEGLLFNQSAGASFFKSLRRAEGRLEYMAVYTKHLPAHRKLFWSTLKFFINKIGSKFMQKY